ncbi:MAG: hypothetical protein ACYC6Y_01365 [Thermoguttaceae bacterium]
MPGEDLASDAPGREVVFCESGPNQVMARTRTCKLILAGKKLDQGLFFDFRADPLEMQNLFNSPQRQAEIQRLTTAIRQWRPAELSQRCVDPEAPQIRGPNVPPPGLEHRPAIMEYYRAAMDKLQAP